VDLSGGGSREGGRKSKKRRFGKKQTEHGAAATAAVTREGAWDRAAAGIADSARRVAVCHLARDRLMARPSSATGFLVTRPGATLKYLIVVWSLVQRDQRADVRACRHMHTQSDFAQDGSQDRLRVTDR